MSKIKATLIALLFITIHSYCQIPQTTFQDNLYQCYINDDMISWESKLSVKAKTYKQADEQTLFDIVNGYYGYIGYLLSIEENDKAEDYFIIASPIVKRLTNTSSENLTYKAYEAAFIAFEMEFSMWKIMSLGSKSQNILEHAMQKGSEIAEVNFEWANMKYYAPSFAGGDKEEALAYYKKAYTILEKKTKTNTWYYLYIKTQYANALIDQENLDEGKSIFKELIISEPNYKLATNKLKVIH